MLGKLLKHEFLASGRIFLPLLALVIAISALTSLMGIIFEAVGLLETEAAFFLMGSLLILAAIFVFSAVFSVPLIVFAIRFYKSFLGSEGYLMFTLPVTRHQLVLSRLITGFVWYAVTGLVATVGALIALAGWIPTGTFLDSMWIFEGMYEGLFGPFGIFSESALAIVTQIISIPVGAISTILMIYLAMGLGQLANNYRIILSIVAYFGILFVTSIASMMITLPITLSTGLNAGFLDMYQFQQTTTIVNVVSLALTAVLCIVMYFGTVYLLNRRLNLL
ncbi:MAG: hypothetical protein FWC99_07210 [Coriobacteriia bacterium]|nr:hypothetical protein [Coriobacteriia bacterium]